MHVYIPYHSEGPPIVTGDFSIGFREENDLEDEYYEGDDGVQNVKA